MSCFVFFFSANLLSHPTRSFDIFKLSSLDDLNENLLLNLTEIEQNRRIDDSRDDKHRRYRRWPETFERTAFTSLDKQFSR